jgi:hypothetical protein
MVTHEEIGRAATRASNVVGLVYVAAFAHDGASDSARSKGRPGTAS